VIDDSLMILVKEKQRQLRSTAADVARARRARQEVRPLKRRPFHLRLLARLFGPR